MENIANSLQIISSIIAVIGGLFFASVIFQKVKKNRKVDFSLKKVYQYLLGFLVIAPVIVAIYFLPITFYDQEFWLEGKQQYLQAQEALKLLSAAIVAFYALVRIAIFLPHKNEYYNIGSQLLLVSLFPGIANALIVMIISKFITDDIEAKYLLFFFAVTIFVYIVSIRISKRQTASLGVLIAHKFNLMIVKKIFKIPYRNYEKVKDGKIYTILNDDINAIFFLSQNAIDVYTAAITSIIVMVYMYSLDFWSSLLLFGVTGFIMTMLVLLSGPLKRTGYLARVKREEYTSLVSGLINGFKELVLHDVKRERFQEDIEELSKKSYGARKANINVAVDAGLFSELSFTITVGVSCLLFPLIFNFEKELITSYVIAVLYLLGPVGILINGIPQIIDTQVSWKRIKSFLQNADPEEEETQILPEYKTMPFVENISVQNVCFTYENENGKEDITYGIGPVNFEANLGELIFIVGGNGSGKTTFLKLMVGLYSPTSGQIQVNGKDVNNKELSECFSVIYSDFYLFKKLYDIKEDRLAQVYKWLEVLQLSDKVKIEDGAFSTINLSQGQRKRLAIIKSYLEDRPVYFFDEVAADLDPEFRSFFYNNLLMKIREEGKILIIISHDDKYFNLADKIYKMDMGTIKLLEHKSLEAVI